MSRERKKKNISLVEISRRTNIGLKALQALENDEFHLIPAGFYLRNYVRSYLAAIGSEGKFLSETYREALQAAPSGPKAKKKTYYTKLRYSRFKKKNAFLGGFIFFLVAAVPFFILVLGKGHVLAPPLQLPLTTVSLAASSTAAPFCIDEWPVQVEIEFLDNCWVQVYRGQQQNQKKISEQVYRKGDHLKTRGYALYFFIGNPAALRFFLNKTELTYLKNQARSERLTINPGKINELLEK